MKEKTISTEGFISDEIYSILDLVKKIALFTKSTISNITSPETHSLSELAKITQVQPIVILSNDCLSLNYTTDLMNTLLTMFSAYYLQAVAILTEIDSIKVLKTIDSLNPDRTFTPLFIGNESYNELLSIESYKYSLPISRDASSFKVCLESKNANSGSNKNSNNGPNKDGNNKDKDNYSTQIRNINEPATLAVGKLLDVSIKTTVPGKKDGEEIKQKVHIPVMVRLAPSVLANDSVFHLLTRNSDELSIKERWHSWRSGRIKFIRDLVFCQDLIDEYRKAALHDKDGVLIEIMRRVKNAKIQGILTQNMSLATASNIIIITETLAAKVEGKLGGKLSSVNIRNKLFENTYGMILCVINRPYERITFYVRGISVSSNFGIKELKSINKDSGPDIMDVMKSFMNGNTATF